MNQLNLIAGKNISRVTTSKAVNPAEIGSDGASGNMPKKRYLRQYLLGPKRTLNYGGEKRFGKVKMDPILKFLDLIEPHMTNEQAEHVAVEREIDERKEEQFEQELVDHMRRYWRE